MRTTYLLIRHSLARCAIALVMVFLAAGVGRAAGPAPDSALGDAYLKTVQPLLKQYCLECHSTKSKKGDLDLERFATAAHVRQDFKVWQSAIEQLDAQEMPPKEKPQPSAEERQQLVTWVRDFLDAEARSRAGDPGLVPLRRLSNAEYDATIRDLTGVDLRPAREFPVDGAAGEGFTNATESLSDITPGLFTKYLSAAKEVSEHVVLTPDGFRFSPFKTRRDWTDEGTAKLRQYYTKYDREGRMPAIEPYIAATIRHREALRAGTATIADVAVKDKLNAKYFAAIWQTLNDKTPSEPLDAIRAQWRVATEKEVPVLKTEIENWRVAVWKTVFVGNYTHPVGDLFVESVSQTMPNDPLAIDSVPLRVAVRPDPGQTEVVLYLEARELTAGGNGRVVWHNPRFEGSGKPPLLLRDYAEFGPALEADISSLFAASGKYLSAAIELANDKQLLLDDLAKKRDIDAAFLKRWVEVLDVEPLKADVEVETTLATPLTLLEEKIPKGDKPPGIGGWRAKGRELPTLITNASDEAAQIPGRVPAHCVVVHPEPKEFVAVAWNSPVAGTVRVSARVTHAHPGCGNGVAWWLEHRRSDRATTLGEGAFDIGKEAKLELKSVKVEKGDLLVLAVDARDGNHSCDLTELALIITDDFKAGRTWDLVADIADNVQTGNPHPDTHGNAHTWSFVRGATKGGPVVNTIIPADSVLGQWRTAAADPQRQAEIAKLAEQAQALLAGPRPPEQDPNRVLYDKLIGMESPLLVGVNVAKLAKPQAKRSTYGLPKDRFGPQSDDANLFVAATSITEVRLPAALFAGREFLVEARLDGAAEERLVAVRALVTPPVPTAHWDGPILGSSSSAAYKQFLRGRDEFRRVFPQFYCFPAVVPTGGDTVLLKMFHRDDEALVRLFLDDNEAAQLDRLWAEHRFVSRQAFLENEYLPLFIGFNTQDQPQAKVAFFEGQRPAFKQRADALWQAEEAAIPKQLDALVEFAGRAFRRPLQENEKADLLAIYKAIRAKNAPHDEAFRGVLTRVLASPTFLCRIEQAPKGKEPGPVNDWELATRLSYFLWATTPDEELRKLAAAGQLRNPQVLAAQTQRMLKDDRTRGLAIEFGTQWIHVRGFDELKEKNEKLFPQFDASLRAAMYEESILFFQDLFQNDGTVTELLDADHTFLNEQLAKHYGIPGVGGPQWRKVDGVRKYGRGGVLGLASVQTKQAGASRTSPILRGNWVVEVLLGEKLPPVPKDVPQLPAEEGGADKLTMRQIIEKHTSEQSCAVCHVRIDPYGFALEKYDPIGRLREKDLGGLPVDSKAKLRDGTEFEGIDGLRDYLLTKKQETIVRLFCRRLLGYALGRTVTLSDTVLLDEMVAELNKNDGRINAAVQAIIRSPQFLLVRGRDHSE